MKAAAVLLGIVFATAAAGQAPRQDVSIQARVLEIDRADLMNLGVLRASGGADDQASAGFATTAAQSLTNALLTKPQTKILQNLQLTTSAGKPTEMRISSRAPNAGDSTDALEAALLVSISSKMAADQKLSMAVNAHIRLEARSPDAESRRPVFSSQAFNQTASVADGETLIMGGFVTENERRSLQTMTALKGNLLLNYVFQGEGSQREMVIMLTPRVESVPITAALPSIPPAAAAVPAAVPTTAALAENPPPPVQSPQPAPTRAPAEPVAKYTVQVAAFKTQATADKLTSEISRRYPDLPVRTVAAGPALYRVQVGLLPDLRAATQLRAKLRNDGFNPIILPLN